MSEEYYLKLLNDNCNVKEKWIYEYPCFKIKINKENHDKIMGKISSIVDCSFFYEFEDMDLYLKITKSTFKSKLNEKKLMV